MSLALSCAIYLQAGNIPNWVLLLLPLSKRLHSIYVLRLFNDCWAVVGAQAAILALGGGWDSMSCILFRCVVLRCPSQLYLLIGRGSLALSVKMSVLLYLPGLAIILWQRRGIVHAVLHLSLILLFQVILGKPFLVEFPRQYLSGAFDLSRVFLFKWTVNWRFLGEEVFLNPIWARALLLGHLCSLLAFAHFNWCRKNGGLVILLRNSLRNPLKGFNRQSFSPDCKSIIPCFN